MRNEGNIFNVRCGRIRFEYYYSSNFCANPARVVFKGPGTKHTTLKNLLPVSPFCHSRYHGNRPRSDFGTQICWKEITSLEGGVLKEDPMYFG